MRKLIIVPAYKEVRATGSAGRHQITVPRHGSRAACQAEAIVLLCSGLNIFNVAMLMRVRLVVLP